MTFAQKLDAIIEKNNSLLCVGLDSHFDKLPSEYRDQDHPQFAFNKHIIDQTYNLVCAYKPNSAFYEARGADGVAELKMTCDYLRDHYPQIPIVLDAKRGDIGSTNDAYAHYVFDYLQADAITLHPYLGQEAVQSFLDQSDKGIIILCRTSNPGSGEFQNRVVNTPSSTPPVGGTSRAPLKGETLSDSSLEGGGPLAVEGVSQELYKTVAQNIVQNWNTNGNCMLVVGAIYPEELAQIRTIAGDMTLLVPGIGAQGGDVEKTVKAGLNSAGKGIMISSSRSIIFSENPKKVAQKLVREINRYRS